MRVLYVANHGQVNSNDDEGAIAFALTQLGHEVVCLKEGYCREVVNASERSEFDLLLFHKWGQSDCIKQVKAKVKAFWYFDLVEWPDPELEGRNKGRREWMAQTIPLVDIGFCTDGDWVANHGDGGGKYIWLPQGADERVVGMGKVETCEYCNIEQRPIDILFVGGVKNCGKGRREWFDFMNTAYCERLHHVERGVHGRELADLVAKTKIVVAPEEPTTGKYWSNRIYVMLGFGACLLHPWCGDLTAQYMDGQDLKLYGSLPKMQAMIEELSNDPAQRSSLSCYGMQTTRNEHLYRHRCEQLINAVKEKM